jgi:hypothetical protein
LEASPNRNKIDSIARWKSIKQNMFGLNSSAAECISIFSPLIESVQKKQLKGYNMVACHFLLSKNWLYRHDEIEVEGSTQSKPKSHELNRSGTGRVEGATATNMNKDTSHVQSHLLSSEMTK